MPSLTKNDLDLIFKNMELDITNFPTFVETGTHYGGTIDNINDTFNQIYSIELSELHYNFCKNKFYNEPKINLILGDSSIKLKEIVTQLNDNCIFFLDGHWSGGNTAKGLKDCPIIEELESIQNNFNKQALIIIDDFRLFGTKFNENWENISINKIENILQSKIIKKIILNDRIILLLK